jgi:hypothetical protein
MVDDAKSSNQALARFLLLEGFLQAKGISCDWIRIQKLMKRDLPGRGRLLSEDLEEFLRNSKKLP